MFGSINKRLEDIAACLEELRSELCNVSLMAQGAEASAVTLERLSLLESRVEQVAGEAAANVVKAESIRNAARSAEERARGMQANAEKLHIAAAGPEEGEEEDPFLVAAQAYQDDADPGDEGGVEEVSPMQSALDGRRASRAFARSQKRRA